MSLVGQDQSAECFGRMTGLSALLPFVAGAANDWIEPLADIIGTSPISASCQEGRAGISRAALDTRDTGSVKFRNVISAPRWR